MKGLAANYLLKGRGVFKMPIESQVLTPTTPNNLKTQINEFLSTNTKRLVSVSYGVKDGEYTALILTFGE
jgi:hypothetical protein